MKGIVALLLVVMGVPRLNAAQQQPVSATRAFRMSLAGREPIADVNRLPLALQKPLTLSLRHVTVERALGEVIAAGHLDLLYSRATVPLERIVTVDVQNVSVAEALRQAVGGAAVELWVAANGKMALVPSRESNGAVRMAGVITGRVMERGTNVPVISASVTVVGAGLTRFTDEKGQYRISGVPAGEREIVVKRLGFEPVSRKAKVGDGETVTVDFITGRVPTMLTEMVTTATGERARIEVGNSIGTIKADSIVPTTLIRNMSDLLTARTPGVVVSNISGVVGAPSRIRIRGVNSLALNNDPIVILDGVRLNAQATVASNETNVGSQKLLSKLGTKAGTSTDLAPSRLDDIEPNTIESIDVLRGPSASSLYGTDAANGVIVIKTKRGKIGAWRANLLGDQGWSTIPGQMQALWWGFWTTQSGNALGIDCLLATGNNVANGSCQQDSARQFNPQNDPQMRTLGVGTAHSLSATLSGGNEQLQEFLSLRSSDNVGIAKLSDAEQRNIARLWTTPAPSWMVRPNTEQDIDGSSRTTIRISPKSSVSLSASAIYRNVLNGGAGIQQVSLYRGASPSDTLDFLPSESQKTKVTSLAKRGAIAANGDYTPWTWLTLMSAVGGDYTLRTDGADIRAQDCTTVLALSLRQTSATNCPSGHTNRRDETFVTTVNVGAQFTLAPTSWINLRTSVGEQYSHTSFYTLQVGNSNPTNCPLAFGTTLLTPAPVCTSSSTQQYSITEDQDEAASAGWYLEESISLFGLYTTFGLRQDVASAFGGQVNKSPPNYPKFSFSYPLSEQSFFPKQSLVSSLRLRLAYGQSGNQASQTAVRNGFALNQVTYGTSSTAVNLMTLSQLGNPDLRPERGTEWEGGFDVSFLENERVHAEVTVYRKFTRDAIILINQPLSYGVDNTSEYVNLGNVENRGVELSTTVKLLDSRAYGWDLTINWTQNANTLVHKAPNSNAFFATTDNNNFTEGYPLYGLWGVPVVSYQDVNGDGILAQNEIVFGAKMFMGAPYPRNDVTYVNSFTFLNGALRINANFDAINGLSNRYAAGPNAGRIPQAAVDRTTSLAAQAAWIQASLNNSSYLGQTSSLRFAELSATYTLPSAIARRMLHVQSAALTFAGRNLALWTTYAGQDPNVDSSGNFGDGTTDTVTSLPQPRNWTLRLNLGL